MTDEFDIAVIGAGPGGYACAIRLAQLGFKTALIEKYSTLGGTCLNVGCIPSKALLDSSEHYYNATRHFAAHGIKAENISVDMNAMIKRKEEVIQQNAAGLTGLMKKNKITVLQGKAVFDDARTLWIDAPTSKKIKAKKIIIATGSKPSALPGIAPDKQRILTSTEMLNLREIPGHLIVIGGGAIGLELGSVFARLGSKVSVIEYMDTLVPAMDREMTKNLQKVLTAQGLQFYLKHQLKKCATEGDKVSIQATDLSSQQDLSLEGDYVLMAVGRRPYTEGLGLEKIGVNPDNKGRIPVNEHFETSAKGVYAIGDVIEGPMLAHKAEEEGVILAEHLAGKATHYNKSFIPGVVYTWPELAGIGLTEEEAAAKNLPVKTGKFPFKANGRARAAGDTDGMVKIISHKETDEILGAHILGPRASDLLGETVVAMEFKAAAEDLARIIHSHPTFSEAIKEAALDATGKRAIHM